MVGPEDDIRVHNLTVSLSRGSSPLEAGRLEVVLPEYLDPPPDGEVVQLVGHLQLEQVVDGEEVEHPAVYPGLEKCVLVLRQPHVVKPASDPLVVQTGRRVLTGLSSRHYGQQDFLPVEETLHPELLLQLGVGEGGQLAARLDVLLHLLAVHVEAHAVEPGADDVGVPVREGDLRLEGDESLLDVPAYGQLTASTGSHSFLLSLELRLELLRYRAGVGSPHPAEDPLEPLGLGGDGAGRVLALPALVPLPRPAGGLGPALPHTARPSEEGGLRLLRLRWFLHSLRQLERSEDPERRGLAGALDPPGQRGGARSLRSRV